MSKKSKCVKKMKTIDIRHLPILSRLNEETDNEYRYVVESSDEKVLIVFTDKKRLKGRKSALKKLLMTDKDYSLRKSEKETKKENPGTSSNNSIPDEEHAFIEIPSYRINYLDRYDKDNHPHVLKDLTPGSYVIIPELSIAFNTDLQELEKSITIDYPIFRFINNGTLRRSFIYCGSIIIRKPVVLSYRNAECLSYDKLLDHSMKATIDDISINHSLNGTIDDYIQSNSEYLMKDGKELRHLYWHTTECIPITKNTFEASQPIKIKNGGSDKVMNTSHRLYKVCDFIENLLSDPSMKVI